MQIIPPKPNTVEMHLSDYEVEALLTVYSLLSELREAEEAFNLEIETPYGHINDQILSDTQSLLMHIRCAERLSKPLDNHDDQ